MPLVLQEERKDKFSVAVWQINENLSFFLDKLILCEAEKKEIKLFNDKRLLEWYASRYLLFRLENKQKRTYCLKDKFGKPYLNNSNKKISISHSGEYIAVAISANNIGVDIQVVSEKVGKIKFKFLSEKELLVCHENILEMNRYWTSKEAMYKAYGKKGLNFIENIWVKPFEQNREYLICKSFVQTKNNKIYYNLFSKDIDKTILTIAIEN